MASSVPGPQYNDTNRNLIRALAIVYAVATVAAVVLSFVAIHHHSNHSSVGFTPIFGFIIVFVGLAPHWQLSPEGLLDLRKFKKSQLIAPYAAIQSVRTLKDKGKEGKTFEVVTAEKTYKVDVLQADAFLTELATHIDPAKITA